MIIELKNITKVFQTSEMETIALDNINIRIDQGEFVAIMGPSGCGKSTILHIMGLLDAPTTGTVIIKGVKAGDLSDRQMATFRNRSIGFIFQSFQLIKSLNVIDNVEMPLVFRGVPARERHALARQVLESVGMSHREHHLPSQLSGGQCQRVAIARAIIGKPNIILADEPTGNLDSMRGAEVMNILKKLNKEEGCTIVMVTHNEEQARQAGRIIRIFDGRQVE